MRMGTPAATTQGSVQRGAWDRCRESLEQRGPEVLGESGENRPGGGGPGCAWKTYVLDQEPLRLYCFHLGD